LEETDAVVEGIYRAAAEELNAQIPPSPPLPKIPPPPPFSKGGGRGDLSFPSPRRGRGQSNFRPLPAVGETILILPLSPPGERDRVRGIREPLIQFVGNRNQRT
jgi:hypothetical protein